MTVTVTCIDDGPAAAVADSVTVNEDSGANTITVLTNDTPDPDGTAFVVTAVGTATNGTTAVGPAGANVTYTPNGNYCGPDSFTYTITGGSSETVSVTVTCIDDGPAAAVADSVTVNEDSGANTITVLTNDTPDPDGTAFVVTAVGTATNGTTAVGPAGANVTYTPNGNYCGPDSFTYTITGGSSATVTVTVTCIDDGPAAAVADSVTVNEDSGANTITVLTNDTPDPDGTAFVVTAVGTATNGTTAVGPAGANVTYTPNGNYCGPDSFTYTITGGSSGSGQRHRDLHRRWSGGGRGRQRDGERRQRRQHDHGIDQRYARPGWHGLCRHRRRYRDQRHDRRWPGRCERDLHAEWQLLWPGQLHLHDHRRQQ
ncbi:MAG: tandem-95 repeat protein [Rhodanobacteraceae bacterium]|nr:tandem-95 repeat protein [Rhodanobacteraceae bacterium]